MFGRGKRTPGPEPDPDGPRDDYLPMLSVEQARVLTAMLATAFREGGLEVTDRGDGVLLADGRQLGLHSKPVVLLNIAKYYDPLLAMIQHGIEHNFIRPNAPESYFVADTVQGAMDYLGAISSP